MPSNIIQSFADKSGKPFEEVEHMWNSLKRELTSRGMGGDELYQMIVGIMKKNLKVEQANMKLMNKYLITEKAIDWEKLVKKIAKKMREGFGQNSTSSGFLIGYSNQSKQFNELTYFQDGGQMRSAGNATTKYLIPPDTIPRDLEMAMKKMLKDPKIMKMKKAFSNMAQGQADYYKKRPMKNWPGI